MPNRRAFLLSSASAVSQLANQATAMGIPLSTVARWSDLVRQPLPLVKKGNRVYWGFGDVGSSSGVYTPLMAGRTSFPVSRPIYWDRRSDLFARSNEQVKQLCARNGFTLLSAQDICNVEGVSSLATGGLVPAIYRAYYLDQPLKVMWNAWPDFTGGYYRNDNHIVNGFWDNELGVWNPDTNSFYAPGNIPGSALGPAIRNFQYPIHIGIFMSHGKYIPVMGEYHFHGYISRDEAGHLYEGFYFPEQVTDADYAAGQTQSAALVPILSLRAARKFNYTQIQEVGSYMAFDAQYKVAAGWPVPKKACIVVPTPDGAPTAAFKYPVISGHDGIPLSSIAAALDDATYDLHIIDLSLGDDNDTQYMVQVTHQPIPTDIANYPPGTGHILQLCDVDGVDVVAEVGKELMEYDDGGGVKTLTCAAAASLINGRVLKYVFDIIDGDTADYVKCTVTGSVGSLSYAFEKWQNGSFIGSMELQEGLDLASANCIDEIINKSSATMEQIQVDLYGAPIQTGMNQQGRDNYAQLKVHGIDAKAMKVLRLRQGTRANVAFLSQTAAQFELGIKTLDSYLKKGLASVITP